MFNLKLNLDLRKDGLCLPATSSNIADHRHDLSLRAQMLESWVRITLEAWMTLCVYSVLVLTCVGCGLASC
jgi:hypothetical protein